MELRNGTGGQTLLIGGFRIIYPFDNIFNALHHSHRSNVMDDVVRQLVVAPPGRFVNGSFHGIRDPIPIKNGLTVNVARRPSNSLHQRAC